MNREELATEWRNLLERHFRTDTAVDGSTGKTPSYGHCAAVACILHDWEGWKLVSGTRNGKSHWFNRDADGFDIDLTGDQFGLPAVSVAPAGHLHRGTRVRKREEMSSETLLRSEILAKRAGLVWPRKPFD